MTLKKRIYKILGLIFFGLGLFGYYMPVFPGTIFMIIAAYFFMNSSDSLYKKIVNNPIYGSPIKQYVENNIISIKSKLVILLSIWIATFFSMFILINVKYSMSLKILGITMSAIGTFFVLRAKNK